MKMKKLVLTAVAVLVTATAARADDNWWNTHMRYDQEHQMAFNANELSLDLFGAYQAKERHFDAFPNTSIHKGNWGGGVGANYFFTRQLGIGADTSFLAGTTRFADHVGGNLFLRLPIEAVRLAPYIFGGGGRAFNPTWDWFEDAGVGLEIRLNPKLGVFGDARYIWKDHSHGSTDQAAIRAGIRLVF